MSEEKKLHRPAPDATTIVLLRPAPSGGPPELFMVRRSGGADFFGDAYVFPGGGVDPGDADSSLIARCAPLPEGDAARLLGEGLKPDEAIACWIAGIRELFEEAGVMLAYCAGAPISFADAATRERFEKYRLDLREHRVAFGEIAERESLTLAADAIFYFSRIVTPPYARKRYDTRFVIAEAPRDQMASHDQKEVVSGEWLTAANAIGLYHSKEQQIVPPTLQILLELEGCGTIGEMIALARAKTIAPVCPATVKIDGVYTLIYPGDRDFVPALEPAFKSIYKKPAAMKALRFTLEKGGRWALAPGVPE